MCQSVHKSVRGRSFCLARTQSTNPAYETRGRSFWLASAMKKLLRLRYGAGGGVINYLILLNV